MKPVILFLAIVFGLLQSAIAQSTYVSGVFPTIDHSGTITKKWDYSLYYFGALPFIDLQPSKSAQSAPFLLFYSEQALTYNVNKQLSFTGSYVFQRENVTKANYIDENRLHVQATYKHAIKQVNLKHRLRFDNRFIRNRATGKTPYTHRLRYLIGTDFLINNKKKNLYFTAYEEAFFNTFKNAGSVYGENWAYAALGVKLSDKNKIEAGPLYITWNTGGNNWFHQYYLQLTWVSHLDFTKPKEKK